MDLFAVLAELDGTGIPLCYLFLGVDANIKAPKSANAGATTCILQQFLQPLKLSGLDPKFFGCDKDRAEIAAIREVWPNTTIQLCYWHAKRAIRNKLKDNRKTRTQGHYYPNEAKNLVPTLEICWGSDISRRVGEHRYNRCQCVSAGMEYVELGSIETTTIKERNTVLQMFSRHYNMHPMISDCNGTYRSAKQIHSDCVNELYTWCYARNYFRLWAYLYVNWYASGNWKLWARSVCSEAIPVLKTTMIVESHWRKIKHDYLHRFNRPMIDLVVWVLISNVIPQAIERMRAILGGNHRKGIASWRKDFKREWDQLQSREVDISSLLTWHTDPVKWTCSCEEFLISRFLICQHIVCCYEKVSDRPRFFSNIRRQRCSPFWVEDQLSLGPEYRSLGYVDQSDSEDKNGSSSTYLSENEYIEENCAIGREMGDEEELVSKDEGTNKIDLHESILRVEYISTLLEQQEAISNTKFIEVYFKNNPTYLTDLILLEEIENRKRQRNMPKTWTRYKHPATMFYK